MLQVISLKEAKTIAGKLGSSLKRRTENAPLQNAAGRILACRLQSEENIPAFARSTMDGYAVFAADTFGASETAPVPLTVAGEIRMGESADAPLRHGTCMRIPTGGMLPFGANAVVPVEYAEEDILGDCLIAKSVSPLQFVTGIGDDVRAGETILPEGTILSAAQIGVLAAAGFAKVPVVSPPKIGMISTGNELVSVDQQVPPGCVRDVNSHILRALCAEFGVQPRFYGVIPDQENIFIDTLHRACRENDFVLLSGGSSAGTMDLTAKTVESLGALLAHGIAIKPGKPTIIGSVGSAVLFGLPGHPAACYFVTNEVVKPAVAAYYGTVFPSREARACLSEHVSSNHGREEFLCVKLNGNTAVPVYGKSGVISQLSRADGYLCIDRDAEGISAGTEVTITLF